MTYDKHNIEFAPLPTGPNFTNLTDRVFSRWTVLGYAGAGFAPRSLRTKYWYCECECGEIVRVAGNGLLGGRSQSCGCLRQGRHPTHGETVQGSTSAEYIAFHSARQRCTDSRAENFHNYGGRGIEFRFESFEEFLTELGRKPTPQHSLERKDNYGHYEAGNVKWATRIEQANNRRSNRLITFNGVTHNLQEWSKVLHIKYTTLSQRLDTYKWTVERAFTVPVRPYTSK